MFQLIISKYNFLLYSLNYTHCSLRYMWWAQNPEIPGFANIWTFLASIELHLCLQVLWFKSQKSHCFASCSSLGLCHAEVVQAVSVGNMSQMELSSISPFWSFGVVWHSSCSWAEVCLCLKGWTDVCIIYVKIQPLTGTQPSREML